MFYDQVCLSLFIIIPCLTFSQFAPLYISNLLFSAIHSFTLEIPRSLCLLCLILHNALSFAQNLQSKFHLANVRRNDEGMVSKLVLLLPFYSQIQDNRLISGSINPVLFFTLLQALQEPSLNFIDASLWQDFPQAFSGYFAAYTICSEAKIRRSFANADFWLAFVLS